MRRTAGSLTTRTTQNLLAYRPTSVGSTSVCQQQPVRQPPNKAVSDPGLREYWSSRQVAHFPRRPAPQGSAGVMAASRPGSAAVAARESPSGRWVTYIRMTRPLKTPDEDGINGPPDRGSIRARVKPSGVQLAVPSRLILLELRLRPRRCYLCRRVDWARRCTPRPDQASLLSWAMGLTTILTTIWVCPSKSA